MILSEHADLTATMIARLVGVFHPKAIYLFGSQAWGSPSVDSDVDLYVVLDSSDESKAERIRHGLRALVDLRFPVDLLVVTEAEIAERIAHPSSLAHKIMTKGLRLYAA